AVVPKRSLLPSGIGTAIRGRLDPVEKHASDRLHGWALRLRNLLAQPNVRTDRFFGRCTRTTGSGRLEEARCVLAPVEAQDRSLAVEDRLDAHRPLPHADERAQRLPRPIRAKVHALVLVSEQELTPVLEVGILHVDEGIARA